MDLRYLDVRVGFMVRFRVLFKLMVRVRAGVMVRFRL